VLDRRGRPSLHRTEQVAIIVALAWSPFLREKDMTPIGDSDHPRSWLGSVLTDIHFWVPLAVLIGGLLLLKSIH
jgi:hypothetical protein